MLEDRGVRAADLVELQSELLDLLESHRATVSGAVCALLGALRVCVKISEDKVKTTAH